MGNKGSPWEREVADLLSYWWCGDRDRRIFWRTSGSGGMATRRNRAGRKTKIHCGDLCAVDPIGEPFIALFAVECKRGYNKHTVQDLIDCPLPTRRGKPAKPEHEKWLEQALEAQTNSGAWGWLIVCRRDKRLPLVVAPWHVVQKLRTLKCLTDVKGAVATLDVEVNGSDLRVCVMPLTDWLRGVPPAAVRRLAKSVGRPTGTCPA